MDTTTTTTQSSFLHFTSSVIIDPLKNLSTYSNSFGDDTTTTTRNTSTNYTWSPGRRGLGGIWGLLGGGVGGGVGEDSLTDTGIEDQVELPTYLWLTAFILLFVIFVVGTIGNSMIIIVIHCSRDMRTSTNIFLVNLSVADLLVLLICTPTCLIEVFYDPELWLLGSAMCKLVPLLEQTVAHASVLTILAISFERYYAICCPLQANYVCTKTRAISICLTAWFAAGIITSPMYFMTKYYIDEDDRAHCEVRAGSTLPDLYTISSIVLFFLLPFAILLITYGLIARKLTTDRCTLNKSDSAQNLRARKQVVLMLGTVVFTFFLCLLPFRVLTMYIVLSDAQTAFQNQEIYYNLLYFCRIMLYINSALNPILYNIMSSKFRNGFLFLCTSRKRRLSRFQRQGTFYTMTTTTSTATTSNIPNNFIHTTHSAGSNMDQLESAAASAGQIEMANVGHKGQRVNGDDDGESGIIMADVTFGSGSNVAPFGEDNGDNNSEENSEQGQCQCCLCQSRQQQNNTQNYESLQNREQYNKTKNNYPTTFSWDTTTTTTTSGHGEKKNKNNHQYYNWHSPIGKVKEGNILGGGGGGGGSSKIIKNKNNLSPFSSSTSALLSRDSRNKQQKEKNKGGGGGHCQYGKCKFYSSSNKTFSSSSTSSSIMTRGGGGGGGAINAENSFSLNCRRNHKKQKKHIFSTITTTNPQTGGGGGTTRNILRDEASGNGRNVMIKMATKTNYYSCSFSSFSNTNTLETIL